MCIINILHIFNFQILQSIIIVDCNIKLFSNKFTNDEKLATFNDKGLIKHDAIVGFNNLNILQ